MKKCFLSIHPSTHHPSLMVVGWWLGMVGDDMRYQLSWRSRACRTVGQIDWAAGRQAGERAWDHLPRSFAPAAPSQSRQPAQRDDGVYGTTAAAEELLWDDCPSPPTCSACQNFAHDLNTEFVGEREREKEREKKGLRLAEREDSSQRHVSSEQLSSSGNYSGWSILRKVSS
jgi:hypothetical protein